MRYYPDKSQIPEGFKDVFQYAGRWGSCRCFEIWKSRNHEV